MACIPLVALGLACGDGGNVGGIRKVYMIAENDLAPVSGDAGDPVYTTATNGIVDAIGIATGQKFVEIGTIVGRAGLKSNGVFNQQNGSAYNTQEFTLTLAGMTVENRAFVESVFTQPVVIVVRANGSTPQHYAAGLDGQLILSALEAGLGTAEGDLKGYKLTFTGFSEKQIPLVDNLIIPTILSPAS
ncbi:MAG: hypothetical protein QM737_02730 [Ferruginibacter sp.]